MIETKEKLIEKVSEILSRKSFTEKAKRNLLRVIVFLFESYSPPQYVQTSKNEYIMTYLKVLENMNGYTVIELSEINDSNEISTFFRNDIVKSPTHSGNLDLVDGKYVPVQNGEYFCSCKGFAWKKEQMIFSLGENDIVREIVTVHHEMTHLTEGNNTFPINSEIPFSYELRKMLYEGRAATHESYISSTFSNVQVNNLEEGISEYQILSNCSYPLYGKLYQILQILFGDEVLEEMAKNDDLEMDMIKELEQRYPNISVQEVFSHLIYILSCKSKESQDGLLNAIDYYKNIQLKKIKWKTATIESQIGFKQSNESYLKTLKKEEESYIQLLGNSTFLKQKHEIACQDEITTIEKLYQDGSYTEEQYQQEMESFKQEGTLEYYKRAKEQELQNNRDEQERIKKSIIELEDNIQELQLEKVALEQNQFSLFLERICLKNPSLYSSFFYLENLAIERVCDERKRMSEGDNGNTMLLDKIRVLMEWKKNTIVISEEKTTKFIA